MSRKRKGKGPRKGRSSSTGGQAAAPRAAGGGPTDGTESEASKSEARQLTTYDHIRENLEALIVAIILAVIIRQFAVEAFEIPTGSMAPTLYGIHAWTSCPNCDTEYNIALRTDSDSGKIVVPYERRVIYDGPCQRPTGCGMDRHFQNSRGDELQRGEVIQCTACGFQFRGEAGNYRETNARDYHSRCPICHFEFVDLIESTNVTGGHKILVTKFAYAVGEPQRWDVIVFTFDQWKNYIKRLVGKPGERIDLWDGDVYVNGVIERKYRHPYIQDILWVKIGDSSVPERGLREHPPAWRELPVRGAGREAVEDMLASWNAATRRWSVNAPGEVAVLEYQRRFDNYYPYNLLGQGQSRGFPARVQVGDKKVEFVAHPVGSVPAPAATKRVEGSWVGAEIREGDFTFQVRIPIVGGPRSSEKAVLRRMTTDPPGLPDPDRSVYASPPLETTADVALRRDSAAHIAFENVDDRAAVFLDGELVLELEYTSLPEGADFRDVGWIRPSTMPSEEVDAHYVRLLVADSQVELSDIRVFRDMYYIGNSGNSRFHYKWASIELEEGQYFALGDNGPSSSDGRFWGYVPESHLMGKAFSVFWPAWPTNFQCKFIR